MTEELTTPYFPKYTSQPATQTPVENNGKIFSWIMRTTMSHGNIFHTVTESYICEPDEVILMSELHLAGPILQEIHKKVNNGLGLSIKCEQELEAILANQPTGE